MNTPPPVTPDGRYIVVRGQLSRAANPNLSAERHEALVGDLMNARRAVGQAKRTNDRAAENAAHTAVDAAKIALGERGAPWWDDGAPDLNRHMARNSEYAGWYEALKTGHRDSEMSARLPSAPPVGRFQRIRQAIFPLMALILSAMPR